MFFNTSSFKSIEAGLSLSWTQQQIHTQNLANLETPGYKSQSLVVFEDALSNAMADEKGKSIHAEIHTDESTSLRPDGNNVNLEIENIGLYKAYTQYSMLIDKASGQFTNIKTVLNSNI